MSGKHCYAVSTNHCRCAAGASRPSSSAPPPESVVARLAPIDKATGRAAHVEVSHRATEVAGGDARVQLSAELPAPPPNTTVQQAHNLESLTGRSAIPHCLCG